MPVQHVCNGVHVMSDTKGHNKEKSRLGHRILRTLGLTLGFIIAVLVAFVTFFSVTEYRPAEREGITVIPSGDTSVIMPGEQITVLTWNTGYGALGDNADFFMDGGNGVQTATRDRVVSNLDFMLTRMNSFSPDIVLLQEVDTDSRRSYGIDATEYFRTNLHDDSGKSYNSAFAYNFKAPFVPYPIPPIGKVNSGIQTLARFDMESAQRIALPCPFKWPIRTANLKRCLLVTRIPVTTADGALADKDLVVINLHLEAYDDGEGKMAQTALFKSILEEELKKGNYVIAGGDFNQTFSNVDVSVYPVHPGCWQSGFIDVGDFPAEVSFVTDSSSPTCRSLDRPYAGSDRNDLQYYVIDGYIVSNNISIENCETIEYEFAATDHNPIVMTVTLN